MEILQAHNLTQDKIESLSRCRGKLEVIFLLNIATAAGQYLEHFAIHYVDNAMRRSTFKFPWEQPTPSDWKIWGQF
jgi:hypothetical protein